jgi:hypothetical protein
MYPLFRIFHSTARALTNYICVPPTIAGPTDVEATPSPAATAAVYLRLVALSRVRINPAGEPAPLDQPSEQPMCTHCASRLLVTDAPMVEGPPRPKTPPTVPARPSDQMARQRSNTMASDGRFSPISLSSSTGSLTLPPTPTFVDRRARVSTKSHRLLRSLVYPPTPRLDSSPTGVALLSPESTPSPVSSVIEPPKALIGLGLGLNIAGIGILPCSRDAPDPGAPSSEFLHDIQTAFSSSQNTLTSLPAFATGLLSPPNTASPLSRRHTAYADVSRAGSKGINGVLLGEEDGEDEDVFLCRQRARPPVNRNFKNKRTRQSLLARSPSPVPRSPASLFVNSPESPFVSSPSSKSPPPRPYSLPPSKPSKKPRSTPVLQRPQSFPSFDQEKAASTAHRSSGIYTEIIEPKHDKPRWKY